jgi:hypothetical protein
MIIIEKSECVLLYSVNSKYFDKFNEVTCGGGSASHWITSESDTSTFIYDLKFFARDGKKGESFIEYKSRMLCAVKIENEKRDALHMLALVKDFNMSMNNFIRNNSLSYFSKLNLFDFEVNEYYIEKMQEGIARLKDMKSYEDKSDVEKKRERELPGIDFF